MARPRTFITLVAGLLAVSLGINTLFAIRTFYPQIWRQAQLALVPSPTARIDDHARGKTDAKVVMIDYSDFQCPLCEQLHQHMEKLVAESNTRWIFRHYPVTRWHPQARPAAEAAECAGEQHRFWDYAHEVFANQRFLTDSLFLSMAAQLKLDLVAFEECRDQQRYADVVDRHLAEGKQLLFTGTPTLFINGERIDGLLSYEQLLATVRRLGG